MLVFLAADADRMSEVENAVRDYLGWDYILQNSAELDLTQNQRNQAAEKRTQADGTLSSRLLGAYHWALVPTTPQPGDPFTIDVARAEGQATHLAERVSRRLGNDGTLNTRQAAANIRLALDRVPPLWAAGYVSVGELWKVYAAHSYMPRLRDQSVLTKGLTEQPLLWEREGFALAQGYDGTRYQGLWLPREGTTINVTDSVLVVKPEAAQAQRQAEASAQPEKDRGLGVGEGGPTAGTGSYAAGSSAPMPGPPLKTRFFAVKELSSEKYGTDFKKVADEILVHLVADPGATIRIRLEIEAEKGSGFDETQVRTVTENANQLGFKDASFESD
jgi:hypothetical protein